MKTNHIVPVTFAPLRSDKRMLGLGDLDTLNHWWINHGCCSRCPPMSKAPHFVHRAQSIFVNSQPGPLGEYIYCLPWPDKTWSLKNQWNFPPAIDLNFSVSLPFVLHAVCTVRSSDSVDYSVFWPSFHLFLLILVYEVSSIVHVLFFIFWSFSHIL